MVPFFVFKIAKNVVILVCFFLIFSEGNQNRAHALYIKASRRVFIVFFVYKRLYKIEVLTPC